MPDAELTANDYVATYTNGIATLTKKSESEELQLSEYYLTLDVGEASAIKVFKEGQHFAKATTSDPKVAVVDEFGGVFATGVGTAELSFEYDGETLNVQVDVVDVSSDATSIVTATGEVTDKVKAGDTFALSNLLSKAGIKNVDAENYTWTTTDANSVVIDGDQVEAVAKSGGYSMVIGTRQVRYDSGKSVYETEKVILPFYVDYGDNGEVYDYDDLLHYDQADKTTVNLKYDLSTDTAYGKIMDDTKLNPGLTKLNINGDGHSIDLTGVPLMSDMTDSKVSGLTLVSSKVLDNAAIINYLPATGTIEDCDINLTIVGERQYLGGAANESQGKIDGVNFFGNITNTYKGTSGDGQIKGKAENCSVIPTEGHYSVQDDDEKANSEAVQIATGTGGIIGRQDVNATYSNGSWAPTNEETGVYNCYGSGSVTGVCNVGGIAGLAIGDWTNRKEGPVTTLWSPLDGAPNAAYVRIYASVSDGSVTATASDGSGIAGGIVGYSVMAEIKGASVSATVKRDNASNDTNKKGRIAGISGIYLPSYLRDDGGGTQMSLIEYDKGEGFRMEGVIVENSDIQKDGTDTIEPFFYNRVARVFESNKDLNFDEYTREKSVEFNLYYWMNDTFLGKLPDVYINNVNAEINGEGIGVMKSNDNESINKGMPIFDTTRITANGATNYNFAMKDSYTYGDAVTPTVSTGVVKTEYKIDGGEYTASKPVDAGKYTARATFADGSTKEDTFTIGKRTVVLVDPNETTLEYTGSQRKVASPYISNLVAGDDVTVEATDNTSTEVGDYKLTVTGLSGDDAANYQLPSKEYTMDWSIMISDQKADSITFTMNGQAVEQVTLYYNTDDKKTLSLKNIKVTVLDEEGNTYYFKDGEAVEWSFSGSGASFKDNVLTAEAEGKGTLTASFGDVKAEIAITSTQYVPVDTIAQGDDAAIVYVGDAYDLNAVPLKATDANGNAYILSDKEREGMTWKVSGSQNADIKAEVNEDNNTLTVSDIGEAQETTIKLEAYLTDEVACFVELTVREQPVVTSITVAPDALSLRPGNSVTLTDTFTVSCTDQFGNAIEPDTLTWTSSAENIAAIRDGKYLDTKADGTATVTVAANGVTSNTVAVTVASVPKLTTIKINGAPSAMAWNETLDLSALDVQQLDQKGQPMLDQQEIHWSVDKGTTNATVQGNVLNTGNVKGTITLKASVTPTMYDSVEIAVGPTVKDLSVEPASLSAKGGAVTATLSGEMLSAGIIVGLFADGKDTPTDTVQTNMAGDACQAVLNVPANESDADVTYTVKISYDGKTYEASPSATVTVAKPSHEPAVTDLSIDKNTFDSKGGEVTVSLKGENLTEAPTVALFDGDKLVKSGATSKSEGTYTATLAVPENTSTSDKTYTVKVSIDGKTYLDKPTASLTVEGKSGGNIGGGGGGGIIIPPLDKDHDVTIEQPDNGKIETSDDKAEAGDEVTITVTPDDGYVVDKITITDEDGKEVEVKDNGDGTYTFTMPDGEVSIEAEFVEEGGEEPPVIDLPFMDVADDAWYAGPVQFVYEQGLMTGVSETDFGPNLTTTRGMIVTMLYRLQGEPEVGEGSFTDVNPDAYYADAVTWAAENDIVSGYGNGSFGANDAITREQLAAILYRYCEAMGYDTSARADLSGYSDADTISSWASDVISWANAMGLINGMSETELAPKATATRAQVAAILERFLTIDWEA